MANITFLDPGTDLTGLLTTSYTGTFTATGTITSDATIRKHGSRSIKVNIPNSGNTAYAYKNGALADAGRAISVWVMFSTVAPATPTGFLWVETASGNTSLLAIGLNTNGTIRICGRGATAINGTTVLVANTWYRFALGYIITSASSWSAIGYINGVSEVSTSNTQGNLGATNSSALVIGVDASASVDTFGTPGAMTIWYDSIYVDDRTDKTDPGDYYSSPSFRQNPLRPRIFAPGNERSTNIRKGF